MISDFWYPPSRPLLIVRGSFIFYSQSCNLDDHCETQMMLQQLPTFPALRKLLHVELVISINLCYINVLSANY